MAYLKNGVVQLTPEERFGKGYSPAELAQKQTAFETYQAEGYKNPQTITSQSLAPTQPYTLPTASTPTAASGAIAGFQEQANQGLTAYQQLVAEDTKRREQAQQESAATRKKDIEEYLGVLGSKGQLQQEQDIAGKSEAVTAARKQVNEYNNQLIQEQAALNRQIEAIQTNPNLTQEQARPQIEEAQRKSARKQADISLSRLSASVVLEGANLDLATANSIIQTKIDTELEPLKIKLEYNKQIDDRLFTSFTEAEKRQWAEVKAEDERTYKTSQTQLEAAHKLWLDSVQNGAPQATSQAILKAINDGDYDRVRELSSPFLAEADKLNTQVVEVGGRKVLYSFDDKGNIIRKTDLGIADGKGVDISLTPEKRRVLLGANFTLSDILAIEKDINQFGIADVLAGITDPTQQKAIQDIYGGVEGTRLTRQNVANLFGILDDETKTGFLGFFGAGKTNKQKLDELMATIKKYQDVGSSDEDILKLMKKKKK